MASPSSNETTPLLPAAAARDARPKATRSVTFDPNPTVNTITAQPSTPTSGAASSSGPPMLAAINNKLRRRNSYGSPSLPILSPPAPKIGPQRTTRTAQKLKLLPNPDFGDEGPDEESGREVYSQYTRIKDPTARRDAARLGRADRDRLPRVTAYCTSNTFELGGLMRYLKGRAATRGASPKLFDECIYTPYSYSKTAHKRADRVEDVQSRPMASRERRLSDSYVEAEVRRDEISGRRSEAATASNGLTHDVARIEDDVLQDGMVDFDTEVHTPEVFLFDYGVVVIWGMSVQHEERFLKELAKFEREKLAPDDVETECFNFYYTREYQARIYNDFITLRDKTNYMAKLAISHALAQSVKTSLFESLVDNTIEKCKDIPSQIALTGKIALSSREINMQIGELFILRINIHLNGSVLDTPELFWVEPQLEPVYQAVRSYLEMDQRVSLLTERLMVIADLLAVLKEQLSHGHGEKLEWIVIVLIAAEILVAAVNIVVDLYAGVD